MDESCYINESVLLNYFAGELPADRRKEVEEWIAASEDNEKMARDIFRLYRAADTLDYMNRVDASAALQQVKGRIHKHRHRISWMVWGQRIAACMALPLLATTLYLILKNPPQEYVEIRTNPGMVAEANLPDGTKVWLNSGSSLKHPVKFTGDTRTVELDGEAYFSVRKDRSKRFVVNTPFNIQTEVLGTEFNMEAYRTDSVVRTTLVSGSVRLSFLGKGDTKETFVIHKGWALIQEIESMGGMAKAIETGLPKMRIEEAAARTQARIDSGVQTIVGVNKYRLPKEDPIDILEIDNTAVRNEQIAALKELRANRDEAAVQKALADITECVKTKKGNLLELAVKAAGLRASLGEISDACEVVVGRYKAIIRTISGVYSSETKKDADFQKACELCEQFAKKEGRQPRIMIAKMGQDGHDRGAKVVATGYADCGFDVDMGPLFQTPAEAARQAVENDVHVMGVSSLAAGHKTLVPQVIEELKKLGREDIIVIAGGVIPAQDYDFLYKAGVAAIFGPGTSVSKAACQILEILLGE